MDATLQAIVARLDVQDRALAAILGALAPEPSDEGTGYEALVGALTELAGAVGDVEATVSTLRSDVLRLLSGSSAPSFAGA